MLLRLVDALDAPELWNQLKRWTGSRPPLRFVALRTARAACRAAAQPAQLESDAAMIAALEAVIAERACTRGARGAAEPAKRWFGELGGEPLALDLAAIEAAVAWGADLRRAFDQLAIAGGDAGAPERVAALVALVSASPDRRGPASSSRRSRALAAAVARWQPALAELARRPASRRARSARAPITSRRCATSSTRCTAAAGSLADWATFHLARHAAKVAGIGAAIATIERGDLAAAEVAGAWERATLLAWLEPSSPRRPTLAKFQGQAHHATCHGVCRPRSRHARADPRAHRRPRSPSGLPEGRRSDEIAVLPARRAGAARLRDVLAAIPTLLPRLAPCVLATPHAVAAASRSHADPVRPRRVRRGLAAPVAHALGALARGRRS